MCRCVRFWIILWGHRGELMLGDGREKKGTGETETDNESSGHAAFLDPDVNKALKKVLNEWGKYLLV